MFFNSRKSVDNHTVRSSHHSVSEFPTRLVKNKRWVHSNQLELGMYVNELDKPWEETRFVFQGFMIDSYETLRAVQQACEYANVQTEKVAIVPANGAHRLVGSTRSASR
ncbi:MAG: DUF3391 domain-containing protein [Granulosicoccus sp.]